MKTNLIISIPALLFVSLTFIFCSKEGLDGPFPIDAPEVSFEMDTILVSYKASGLPLQQLNWNGQGHLELLGDIEGLKYTRYPSGSIGIFWDQSLGLGLDTYKLYAIAKSPHGISKDSITVIFKFTGLLNLYYNTKPNTHSEYIFDRQYIYFEINGDIVVSKYTGNAVVLGKWEMLSDNTIEGNLLKVDKQVSDPDAFMAFRISFNKDYGHSFANGFWYEGNEVVPGSEAGDIYFINPEMEGWL